MNIENLKKDGWTHIDVGGFTGHAGPFWMRGEGEHRAVGLLVDECHCNNHMGTIHGGAIMTFADMALGVAASGGVGSNVQICATATLNTQFISVARVGEFIHCQGEVIRRSNQLIFVRGLIQVDDRVVASAEGIWKIMRPKVN